MSPNIISWRASASDAYTSISSTSPVSSQSATPSVVSIDSIVPEREIMAWPNTRELQPVSESPVKLPPNTATLSEAKAPIGLRPVQDEEQPFMRHDTYYFEDGNITFLVDGTLYCVHRYFFARDSIYFSTRFTQLNIREHDALPTLISLGDIKRGDFEAFLSILYPLEFDGRDLSYEQWKAVLHLSTLWGFASVRRLALASLKPPTPFDQLLLGRAYSVEHYIVPALSSLCERPEPLTLGEVRQMSAEDVVLVTTIRESIRGGALLVRPSDIPGFVQTALSHIPKLYKEHSHLSEEADRRTEQKQEADADVRAKKVKLTEAKAEDVAAEAAGEEAGVEAVAQAESVPLSKVAKKRQMMKARTQARAEAEVGAEKVEVEVAKAGNSAAEMGMTAEDGSAIGVKSTEARQRAREQFISASALVVMTEAEANAFMEKAKAEAAAAARVREEAEAEAAAKKIELERAERDAKQRAAKNVASVSNPARTGGSDAPRPPASSPAASNLFWWLRELSESVSPTGTTGEPSNIGNPWASGSTSTKRQTKPPPS